MSSSKDLDDIFAHLDTTFEHAIDELSALVRIPGVSAAPTPDLLRCAKSVEQSMRESGLATSMIDGYGPVAVFGERIVDPALPTVLFYGHYDVQPAHESAGWKSPPFEPTLRDGRIYGRGSSDNKGQHLAQLRAIRAVLAVRGELPLNVKVLIEGEEEIGSPHLADLARDHQQLLRADIAITSDGPVHRSGLPQLVLGTRGQLGVEIRATGANQDAHSGNQGGLLPDPAAHLVRALASLWRPDGRVAVPGFYDQVVAPTAEERKNLDSLPLDVDEHLSTFGIDKLPAPHDVGFYDRLMLLPTMTIIGMSSGYTGPGVKTIISHSALARLDIRLVPGQLPDEIFEQIKAHLHSADRSLEVVKLSAAPATRTAINNPYVQKIEAAIEHATGQTPLVVPSLGSTLPNYVFTDILSMSSVLVPYANADQNSHAENENMQISRYQDGMRICAALMHELAE